MPDDRTPQGVGPADADLRIAAGERSFEKRIGEFRQSLESRFRYHTIELPDGRTLPGLQSTDHLRWRLSLFGLPEDLRGKRVLDIGAWDGWFSFECERRGADVTATDCVALDTFLEARELLGSRVTYLELDVAELSASKLGTFDIVLFFGVLYHLRHPLAGLEKVVELCRDTALIESYAISPEDRKIPAVMEFYERGELGGQIDNWCGPSPEALLAMCRSAGFAQADLKDLTNQRASVVCRRRWPGPPAIPSTSPPHLGAVVNNRTQTAFFHPAKDEYLCCYFRSSETEPVVYAEVDGFGTQTLALAQTAPEAWQANCLKPPALTPGRHEVRIRTAQSDRSNPIEIVVADSSGAIPDISGAISTGAELLSAQLQPPGDLRLAFGKAGTLVCYFRAAVERLSPLDVEIDTSLATTHAHSVGPVEPGVWQANLSLDRAPAKTIQLRIGRGPWSRIDLVCDPHFSPSSPSPR